MVRPARYFNAEVRGGGSLVTDTVANAVTLAAPDDVDRTSFAVRLGALPAAVRYEADVSMPRTCESRIAGLIFGRGEQGDRYGVVVRPSGGPLYLVRLVRFAADGVSGLGGGVMWRDPFDTPASRHHLAVEIRGRSVSWSVDGGPSERVEVAADVVGQIGVVAGPRCTVRYENLRVTPVQ